MRDRLRSLLGRGALPVAAVASALTVLCAASGALAADCDTLPNPVYIAGSSASKPFLAKVAAELGKLDPPVTLIYSSAGSCAGVNFFTASPVGTVTGTGVIWSEDAKEVEGGCALPMAGATVDIGVSDVYPETCDGAKLPADVKDFHGPVQAMTFVVPADSSESKISAEAAYLVFGLGEGGEVEPWSDEMTIERRAATSGTQQMIGSFLGVPAAKFEGHENAASGDLITALAASATAGNANKAIGILSTDAADKNRSALKVLAYQHFGQTCSYLPDSTSTSFDKQNVRDGHYPIWGPLHMLARTSGGSVANADAKKVVDVLSGATEIEGLDLIKAEAGGGVVPDCAMRVKRSKDGGDLASYMPAKSCECKFVAEATGTAPDSCKTCEKASDCDKEAPACNYGYCEVK